MNWPHPLPLINGLIPLILQVDFSIYVAVVNRLCITLPRTNTITELGNCYGTITQNNSSLFAQNMRLGSWKMKITRVWSMIFFEVIGYFCFLLLDIQLSSVLHKRLKMNAFSGGLLGETRNVCTRCACMLCMTAVRSQPSYIFVFSLEWINHRSRCTGIIWNAQTDSIFFKCLLQKRAMLIMQSKIQEN